MINRVGLCCAVDALPAVGVRELNAKPCRGGRALGDRKKQPHQRDRAQGMGVHHICRLLKEYRRIKRRQTTVLAESLCFAQRSYHNPPVSVSPGGGSLA